MRYRFNSDVGLALDGSGLSVHVSQHDIDRSQYGRDVCEQVSGSPRSRRRKRMARDMPRACAASIWTMPSFSTWAPRWQDPGSSRRPCWPAGYEPCRDPLSRPRRASRFPQTVYPFPWMVRLIQEAYTRNVIEPDDHGRCRFCSNSEGDSKIPVSIYGCLERKSQVATMEAIFDDIAAALKAPPIALAGSLRRFGAAAGRKPRARHEGSPADQQE